MYINAHKHRLPGSLTIEIIIIIIIIIMYLTANGLSPVSSGKREKKKQVHNS